MESHWRRLNSGVVTVSNTPEGLWKQACEYFLWCDDNKIENEVTITSGKNTGTQVINKHIRPYSLKGLCLHCGITEEYLNDIRSSKDNGSMYYIVVSKILYVIYTQIYEMAQVGVFNPVFSMKILGMDRESEPTKAITVNIVRDDQDGLPAPTLSFTENEVLERLETEKRLGE